MSSRDTVRMYACRKSIDQIVINSIAEMDSSWLVTRVTDLILSKIYLFSEIEKCER